MTTTPPVVVNPPDSRRTPRSTRIAAIVVGVLGLVPAGFAMFMAQLMTYGLYSWQEPRLDCDLWLPLLAFSLCLSLGPAVMISGPHRHRWTRVTSTVFLAAALLASVVTWIPVAL